MHETEKLKEFQSNIRIPCRSSVARAVAIGKAKAAINKEKTEYSNLSTRSNSRRRHYPP